MAGASSSAGILSKGGRVGSSRHTRLPSPFVSSLLDREDLPDDMAVDVGEAVVAAAVAVGQSLVIEAHQVQDRRVQVVDVDLVLHGVPAEFVGGPVDMAAVGRRRRPSTW